MRMFLSTVDPADQRRTGIIQVAFPTGTTVHDLRVALARAGLSDPDDVPALYVGASALEETAPLASPPLLEGAAICFGRAGADPGVTAQGLLHLHVTSGPDAGQMFALGPGEYRVGRAAEASVRIQDSDLSRVHLLIELSTDGTSIHDLRSTNGTWLAGRRLDPVATPWRPGQRLRVGSSVLELTTHGSASAATTFDDSGHILVNRRPRLAAPRPVVDVRLPAAPEPRQHGRLPVMTMVLPLLLAVPMALLQHAPAYLLFGAMSPAMMLGSFLSDRRGGHRDSRRLRAQWADDLARSRRLVEEAVAAEAEHRRSELPDCAVLLMAATTPLGRLWERRTGDEDALVLRLGLGDLPSSVSVVDPDDRSPAGPPMVTDVPVGLNLRATGVVGVTGPRGAVAGLARSMIAQLAGWHSPREVQLVLLADGERALTSWTWAFLMPHLRPPATDTCHRWVGALDRADQVRQRVGELLSVLEDRIESLRNSPGSMWSGSSIVVVLDGAHQLRAVPGLTRVLEQGPTVGIYGICLEPDAARLPVECRAIVALPDPGTGSAPEAVLSHVDGAMMPLIPDLVGAGWADRFGRALAPLRDATPEDQLADLPDRARLLDLLGDGSTEPSRIASDWAVNARSCRATIGMSADGPYVVDLRHDGPHILIGGTTGAGKSELLQTFIASLALSCSPEQLGFVLVDYKGGSAFEQCARLPHTLGLVTDLDPHLAERALTSLTAEIKRRESILRGVGAKDIDDYAAKAGAGRPPLARLVLVIDEFKMLAEELPEFLHGMVRLAALGRSLGVHLVLATQRPAGIVSADIAANVNLRIALRVRDQVDSEDVIEARDAAGISTRTPGRAYARSGSNPLVPFQTARVAGSGDPPGPASCTVERLCAAALGDPPRRTVLRPHSGGVTDLSLIVGAVARAAKGLALPPARQPWLPPLREIVTIEELSSAPDRWHVPYAVVDRPEQQRQDTLAWDLAADTHLAVAGTMRSGRSSLLRTVAGSIAARFSPAQVHLHAIDDGSGAMQALARLPHAGVVAGCDDAARSVRLLDRLTEEVARRRSLFGVNGFGCLAEQHAEAEPPDRLPYLVLLIDGWESVTASWESVEHGRPIETLHQLMRDGAGVGLRVAITGDRSLLMSRISGLVRDKVVLRLADPTDLTLAGIPLSAVPERWPAGRGLRVIDRAEIQVALLTSDPAGPAQIAALDRIARDPLDSTAGTTQHCRPMRIERLPLAITRAELARPVGELRAGWALVGAGGDAAEPLGLSLAGSSALVAGPGKSGRSTTLATMATWLGEHGTPIVGLVAGRSTLADVRGGAGILDVVERTDVMRLRDLLAGRPDCCVVADDVERLIDTEAEDVVLQWFKSPERVTGSLLVGGNAADLTSLFRGLSVVARRSGQGVLLSPTSYADGELLGVRVAAIDHADLRPGRGLLIRNGRATPIQVAH
ncbi:MAG: FtsK/SpoIIIE domain-containing protein [Actinomycetota bacterium]|nr:FtsK/SpoIIIE domain-containing protein [Actinomycetota bacterium]